MTVPLRCFRLIRDHDVSGVSGTGAVAEGVRFSDGRCAMRWVVGRHRSTTSYDSLDSLLAIHGHGGYTTLEWVDDPHHQGPRNS